MRKRIKIAVLDTGIDMTDDYILSCEKRIKFQSFLPEDPDVRDEDGHGTSVASLLLRVAKTAKICVARITRSRNLEYRDSIAEVRVPDHLASFSPSND